MREKNNQTNIPGSLSDGRSVTDVSVFIVDLSALKKYIYKTTMLE